MKGNLAQRLGGSLTRQPFTLVPADGRVSELKNGDRSELLAFLAVRPVHNVAMTSFILDNGVESTLNRGQFFGYRNAAGDLEGVALIGHTTLVEARSQPALTALALAARSPKTPIHMIMSSGDGAQTFWNLAAGIEKQPKMVFTELLFEVKFPLPVHTSTYLLRHARPDELSVVAEAHAEVAIMEQGSDPMARDRDGFLRRTLRRIEQGRVFVVFEGDRLVFKADILAETDSVAYIEGLYVAPEYRGQGVAPKCLSKMFVELLRRVENVCLLSNVEFTSAHRSFAKAGMTNTDACTTLFV